jgi:hypothetical protein
MSSMEAIGKLGALNQLLSAEAEVLQEAIAWSTSTRLTPGEARASLALREACERLQAARDKYAPELRGGI